MRRTMTIVVCLVAASAAMAAPAQAHDTSGGQHEPHSANAAFEGGSGFPAYTPDMMTDSLTEACLQSILGCGPGGVTCSLVSRDDRTNGPVPANASEIIGIYFVPNDFQDNLPGNTDQAGPGEILAWDLASVCTNGSRTESNLGQSLYNLNAWMAGNRPATTQGNRVNGRGFDVRIRSFSQYQYTYTFRHILFVRGQRSWNDYNVDDSTTMVIDELRARGWERTLSKHIVYADVESTGGAAGRGQWNSNGTLNVSIVLRRFTTNGTVRQLRFGCADEGDVAVGQEILHTFGLTPASGTEVSPLNGPHPYHTWLGSDVLYWTTYSTFSGQYSNGANAPGGRTRWDDGADTYTSRMLTFTGHLGSTTGTGFHVCGRTT